MLPIVTSFPKVGHPATTRSGVSVSAHAEQLESFDWPQVTMFFLVGKELFRYLTVKLKIFHGRALSAMDHNFIVLLRTSVNRNDRVNC